MIADLLPLIAKHILPESRSDLILLKSLVAQDYAAETYCKGRTLKLINEASLKDIMQNGILGPIRSLDLSQLDVDDNILLDVSTFFHEIEQLKLTHSRALTDNGVKAFLAKHGHALKVLVLERCYSLTDMTLHLLAIHCTSLRVLRVKGCMFSDAGLIQLCSESSFFPDTLKEINLSRCHMLTSDTIIATLLCLKKLKRLDLSSLDGITIKCLEPSLKKLPHLKVLNIRDCPEITTKDIEEIKLIRPKLKITHNAVLQDHSTEAIRLFLLALI